MAKSMQKLGKPVIVQDMGAAKERISLVFHRLKPKKITEQGTYLPFGFHEMMIEHFSEDLALMIFPEPAQPSLSATKGQLKKLEESGRAFWIALASLQGPAIDALKFTHPTLGELQRTVERILDATARARTSKEGRDRKGAKPKSRAQEIAVKAADYYARITGKRPVRITYPGNAKAKYLRDRKALAGGEFIDFLNNVFEILNVNASADRYGKLAIRVWTNDHPYWPK